MIVTGLEKTSKNVLQVVIIDIFKNITDIRSLAWQLGHLKDQEIVMIENEKSLLKRYLKDCKLLGALISCHVLDRLLSMDSDIATVTLEVTALMKLAMGGQYEIVRR